jgi:hypothetical protein
MAGPVLDPGNIEMKGNMNRIYKILGHNGKEAFRATAHYKNKGVVCQ